MNKRFSPRRVALFCGLFALVAAAVFVSPSSSGQERKSVREEVGRVLSSFDELTLDPAQVLRQVRQAKEFSLETSAGTLTLELEPHDLRAPHHRAEVWGEGGFVRQLERGPVRTYKGQVRGMKGARARFTIDEQTVEGLIIKPDGGLYFVEPAKNLSASAGAKDFVFYAESSVKRDPVGECGVTLAQKVGERAASARSGGALSGPKEPTAGELFGPAYEVDIAVEADFEYVQGLGTASSASDEIVSIMNGVEGIYDPQLGLQFRIVFSRLWETNTDPYTTTNSGDALEQLTDLYDGSFGGVAPARDLVHMWTGKDFVGSTVGIAWISGFNCQDTTFLGYGISQRLSGDPVPEKFVLTAHELGHNFGAQHVTSTTTGCGGTIMNPSVSPETDFCEFSKDQITELALDNTSCMTRLAAPPGCSYMLSPAAQQLPAAGGAGSANLFAPAGCPWGVAQVFPAWVTFNGPEAGTGNASFTFNASANPGGPREARADVGGQILKVGQEASPICPKTPISETASGTLSTTDCLSGNAGRENAFTDLYTFEGVAGQRLQITMSASIQPNGSGTGLDTFLYLFGPSGTIVAENDDIILGQATNSQIPVGNGNFLLLPQTGTYIIAATSFDDTSNDLGAYNIVLSPGIADNDVSIAGGGLLTVAEGTGAGGVATEGVGMRTVTVTRSTTAGAASVDYATSGGTASPKGDYTSAAGTLRFAPGEASKTFQVLVTDDRFDDEGETVNITLSNPSGVSLSPTASTALLTIADNDAADGPSPVRSQSFDTRFFVRQHYLDFLGREPDQGGMDFWSNGIDSCGADQLCLLNKRVDTSAAFFLSIEFQETGFLVQRVYKAAYGEATGTAVIGGVPTSIKVPVVRFNEFLPDSQRIARDVIVGTAGWPERLEANKNAFALEFVQRARFTAAFPSTMTPAAFVDALIANAGITPDAGERQALVDHLTANNSAAGRAFVLRRIAEDPEMVAIETNKAFVLMQYFGYLRRNPDDPQDSDHSGYNFWLTKLNQFGGDFRAAQMVFAFIDSIEYKQRFGQP